MASSVVHLYQLKLALLLILVIMSMLSLTVFASNSDGSVLVRDNIGGDDDDDEGIKQMKLVLGSKPPRCVNKCFSCRPCMAALVLPPHTVHHMINGFKGTPHDQDESYYLLTWKCRCRDKFFQP